MREMPNVTMSSGPMRPLHLQDGVYPYLNVNIRDDIGAIPESRTNPVSPLQMLSATNMIADGYRKVRSINPFGRAKRTREGMALVGQGTQMVYQPIGYGSRLQ